jgi:hypothetical protein
MSKTQYQIVGEAWDVFRSTLNPEAAFRYAMDAERKRVEEKVSSLSAEPTESDGELAEKICNLRLPRCEWIKFATGLIASHRQFHQPKPEGKGKPTELSVCDAYHTELRHGGTG